MNIHDIILEDKRIDEKPTSSIGNFAKKVASKVTTGGTSARLGGSAEMGKRSNEIYKDLARWQGINGKNDKNMTAQDLAAFMKQHKLSAGGMDLPDGVLPKKIVDAALKKAAANDLTGGNAAVSKSPAQAPAAKKPGFAQGALDAMAKGAGTKKPSTTSTSGSAPADDSGSSAPASTDAKAPASTDAKAPASGNVSKLKTKGGITPDVQAMIDKLTPTEKKALAGAI